MCGFFVAQMEPDRTDFFRRWARSMREGRGSGILFVIVVALLVGAFLLLRWLTTRSGAAGRRARDDPMALFHGLVDCHRLGPSRARVLQEVAAHNRLPDPGILFARPSLFDKYLEEHLRRVDDDELRRQADQEVARLRDRIFGQIDEGAESAAFDDDDYKPLLDE
jgi:hypothetical protein